MAAMNNAHDVQRYRIAEKRSEFEDVEPTQEDITREFFYEALCEEQRIGALEFDYIYSADMVSRRGRSARYGPLLINSEIVAVVEIKHHLHRRDVEHVHKTLAPKFRYFFREWADRKLLFVMAYITASPEALAAAREYGYATLSPDGQKVRADMRCVRYAPGSEP